MTAAALLAAGWLRFAAAELAGEDTGYSLIHTVVGFFQVHLVKTEILI